MSHAKRDESFLIVRGLNCWDSLRGNHGLGNSHVPRVVFGAELSREPAVDLPIRWHALLARFDESKLCDRECVLCKSANSCSTHQAKI